MSSDTLTELVKLTEEAGVRLTFSRWCRTGLVGDLCRCWRCRGQQPEDATEAEEREAQLIDRAFSSGHAFPEMKLRAAMKLKTMSEAMSVATEENE